MEFKSCQGIELNGEQVRQIIQNERKKEKKVSTYDLSFNAKNREFIVANLIVLNKLLIQTNIKIRHCSQKLRFLHKWT